MVLRGQGGVEGQNLGCAVTILETNVPQEVVGLVRFMQLDEEVDLSSSKFILSKYLSSSRFILSTRFANIDYLFVDLLH